MSICTLFGVIGKTTSSVSTGGNDVITPGLLLFITATADFAGVNRLKRTLQHNKCTKRKSKKTDM